jgi:hypothetical protein
MAVSANDGKLRANLKGMRLAVVLDDVSFACVAQLVSNIVLTFWARLIRCNTVSQGKSSLMSLN